MDKLPENIKQAFNRFAELHKAHLDMITQTGTDYARLNFERSRAFENLKNFLSAALREIQNGSAPSAVLPADCREQISGLLQRNQALSEDLAKDRKDLAGQMQHLRSGKRVLKKYGAAESSGGPVFVSQKE